MKSRRISGRLLAGCPMCPFWPAFPLALRLSAYWIQNELFTCVCNLRKVEGCPTNRQADDDNRDTKENYTATALSLFLCFWLWIHLYFTTACKFSSPWGEWCVVHTGGHLFHPCHHSRRAGTLHCDLWHNRVHLLCHRSHSQDWCLSFLSRLWAEWLAGP